MTGLAALLATLIPGTADWPTGSLVADQVLIDASATPDAGAALDSVLAALPADFAYGDEAAAQAIEASQPAAFERVLTLAYTAYYTDPRIRQVIERLTGYEARPPQPLGYALPPFDDSLLDIQRRRAPFWRDPDAEPSTTEPPA